MLEPDRGNPEVAVQRRGQPDDVAAVRGLDAERALVVRDDTTVRLVRRREVSVTQGAGKKAASRERRQKKKK